jgi:hypothetical protein
MPLIEKGTYCEGCKEMVERYGSIEVGDRGQQEGANSKEKDA